MARRGVAALAAAVVASAIGIVVAQPAAAAGGQVLISDTFANATTSGPVIGLSTVPGFPCLTAGTNTSATPIPGCGLGSPDAAGSGVLRFTDTTGNTLSGIAYSTDVPLSQGLTVEFKVYQWSPANPNPADGVLFALAAAPPGPTQLGPVGGFLGYGTSPAQTDPGLPAGYLGVGFDTYGEFADKVNEPAACPDPGPPRIPGRVPQSISVRGPGNGMLGYCLLSNSGANSTFFYAGSRSGSVSGVEILIDPATNTYTVGYDIAGGTSYVTEATGPLPASWYDQGGVLHSGLPGRVTFVLTGGTGTFFDNNEISDLTAVTLNGPVPILTLTADDDHNGATFPNGTFRYVLHPRIDAGGAAETDPTSLALTATLPANTTLAGTPTGSGWNCSASSGSNVSCIYTVAGTIPAGTDLPAVTIPVQVSGASIGDSLDLTANFTSTDAAQPVQAGRSVSVGNAPASQNVPSEPVGQDQRHNSEASNDPSQQHNDEGDTAAAATATLAQPAVSTPCSSACTLAATTTDTIVAITAEDTAFHGTSTQKAPTFTLAINGGGAEPRCPSYRTSDHDWVQFGFRSGGGRTFQKTGRVTTRRALTRNQALRVFNHRQVCFEAPYRFATAPGYAPARHGGVFDGVLPDCRPTTVGPCIRSRDIVRVGYGWGVRIVFYVPPNKRDPKALG